MINIIVSLVILVIVSGAIAKIILDKKKGAINKVPLPLIYP
ncbi:MAG: FeoB-associated Cys-rich membrane protein [Bacillota bacterium]